MPVQVVHTPASGDFSDTSGNEEWNIDMQAIHGMAPGISKEVLYFAPTLADTDLVGRTAAWVNDKNGPPIMNASLGECESHALNPVLNNAAARPGERQREPQRAADQPGSRELLRAGADPDAAAGRDRGRARFSPSSGDSGSSCTAVYPGTNGIGN